LDGHVTILSSDTTMVSSKWETKDLLQLDYHWDIKVTLTVHLQPMHSGNTSINIREHAAKLHV